MEVVFEKILVLFLLLVVLGRSAVWAIRASAGLARIAGITEFVISLVLITLISVLPETVISLFSALGGDPALGLGALIGSNVADLTLVFGAVAIVAPHAVVAQARFVTKDYLFLSFLLLPLALGFTGSYSRLDGIILIAAGILFFWIMITSKRREGNGTHRAINHHSLDRELLILLVSLVLMGSASYYAVYYAREIATIAGVAPALIGILIIAPGTCLPELIFSVRAIRKGHATLALVDVLGTVIADATLILGILALISPFTFNPRIIIVTGIFMLLAGFLFFSFLRSGRKLTRVEGAYLLAFYALFIIVEFSLRNWTPLITR